VPGVEVDHRLHGDVAVLEEVGDLLEQHRTQLVETGDPVVVSGQHPIGQEDFHRGRAALLLHRHRRRVFRRGRGVEVVEQGCGGVRVGEQQRERLGAQLVPGRRIPLVVVVVGVQREGVGEVVDHRIPFDRSGRGQFRGQSPGARLTLLGDQVPGPGPGQPHPGTAVVGGQPGPVALQIGLDGLGLREVQDPAGRLLDRRRDRGVDQGGLFGGERAGDGGDLLRHPGLDPQVVDQRPQQRQPVPQVECLSGLVAQRDGADLQRDRQLGPAQLRCGRGALTAQRDQPVPTAADRDRTGPGLRVLGMKIGPMQEKHEPVHTLLPARGDLTLGDGQSGGRVEVDQRGLPGFHDAYSTTHHRH